MCFCRFNVEGGLGMICLVGVVFVFGWFFGEGWLFLEGWLEEVEVEWSQRKGGVSKLRSLTDGFIIFLRILRT